MAKKELQIINPNAAGIDIGTENYHVSVDGKTVKVFETYTESGVELLKYLKANGVKTVAMESTGVLWSPLYDILEKGGIEVCLVNGSHVSNIPAQKSDFQDCRWIQKVHSYGFLRASFIPEEIIRELRIYVRQREDIIEAASESILHMQRAFEYMNIKLHNVLSDIKGKSGIMIIEAILGGERDASKLMSLLSKGVSKSKYPAIKASLVGNYKREYIFLLKQGYERYQFLQHQLNLCDKEIETLLKEITKDMPQPPETPSSPSRHNHPSVDNLHTMLTQMTDGRDATVLPGFCDKTILKLVAELGTDLSCWPTDCHFTSWMGLSPRKKQSGKMNRTKYNPVKSKVGQIFRESAMSIANSKHLALRGFYNRIKSRHGYKKAIKATARKLAVLYYRFMTKGLEYVERGMKEYEERYRILMFKNLKKKASKLGFELVEVANNYEVLEYV